jgi:hypothetical protein
VEQPCLGRLPHRFGLQPHQTSWHHANPPCPPHPWRAFGRLESRPPQLGNRARGPRLQHLRLHLVRLAISPPSIRRPKGQGSMWVPDPYGSTFDQVHRPPGNCSLVAVRLNGSSARVEERSEAEFLGTTRRVTRRAPSCQGAAHTRPGHFRLKPKEVRHVRKSKD